jgi:hypothetical protein
MLLEKQNMLAMPLFYPSEAAGGWANGGSTYRAGGAYGRASRAAAESYPPPAAAAPPPPPPPLTTTPLSLMCSNN